MNVLAISLQDLKDLHRIETNRLIYENRHHRTTRFFLCGILFSSWMILHSKEFFQLKKENKKANHQISRISSLLSRFTRFQGFSLKKETEFSSSN